MASPKSGNGFWREVLSEIAVPEAVQAAERVASARRPLEAVHALGLEGNEGHGPRPGLPRPPRVVRAGLRPPEGADERRASLSRPTVWAACKKPSMPSVPSSSGRARGGAPEAPPPLAVAGSLSRRAVPAYPRWRPSRPLK